MGVDAGGSTWRMLAVSAMKPLLRSFYLQPTRTVARRLLGKILVHDSAQGRTAGRIVETEAYLRDDPACHAVSLRGGRPVARMTERNKTMFGPPGYAYVYFTYGNHYCLNAVTQPEGVAEAVLIRALEPLEGIALMRQRRCTDDLRMLARGPGRLCQAMGITLSFDGADLTCGSLFIADAPSIPEREVLPTGRIGIRRARDKPWRFIIASSPFLSRRHHP